MNEQTHAVHGGIDVGEWPGPLSWKTLSGKSVWFLTARALTLLALCIYSWAHADLVVFALAATAFLIDIAHTVLQTYIQVRGLALQRWIKCLIAGDLDFRVEPRGSDEIAMYTRVLEALRSSMEQARVLDGEQRLLSAELTKTLDELKATQDRIVSQQKLAELGELSAGVAHEIRNPLQFIKNFAESSGKLAEELTELMSAPSSDEVAQDIALVVTDLRENMGRIVTHSERANRIVTDMLGLRRESSGQVRPTDINRVVHEHAMLAYHASRAEYPEFPIEIVEELDPGTGVIDAVPNDLGRVVINVVNNACQAMREKAGTGSGGYRAQVRLATRATADEVIIAIRDNGPGMAREVAEKMFTPFFTTKQGHHGTGLGMSLSHEIARAHGGVIEVETSPGEGTELILKLPVTRPSPSIG